MGPLAGLQASLTLSFLLFGRKSYPLSSPPEKLTREINRVTEERLLSSNRNWHLAEESVNNLRVPKSCFDTVISGCHVSTGYKYEGVCVCVGVWDHLMGLGRDPDEKLHVLSSNRYLSLMKGNKERKRKPTHINMFLQVHHSVSSTEQGAPVTDTMMGPI